jgi:uncharacterized protein YfaT (DUF1175 family)
MRKGSDSKFRILKMLICWQPSANFHFSTLSGLQSTEIRPNVLNWIFAVGAQKDLWVRYFEIHPFRQRNCLGSSRFGPKRPLDRHTSPIFSSDTLHRTRKLARLALNCLVFGLKTADLNSYPQTTWICVYLAS